MINAILVFNNHGKPRLVRFYQHLAEEVQQQIIRETFHLVLKRDDHICNFLECGSLFGGSDYKLIYRHYATLYFVFCVDSSESELGILDLIQVFVETLDKCFENVCELDLIFHMDKCCSADCPMSRRALSLSEQAGEEGGSREEGEYLRRSAAATGSPLASAGEDTLCRSLRGVTESRQLYTQPTAEVHHILQEMVIGGMVLETNMNEIVAQVEAQSKLEKAEGGLSAAPSRAVSAVKNINLPEIPRNINIGDINIKVPNLSQFM
uniref:Adaptor related protein complex 3 subunit sigma 2 n=1 Tax=Strigops habroptila TaxID=2489341 RepID=A0A672U601_STRHB